MSHNEAFIQSAERMSESNQASSVLVIDTNQIRDFKSCVVNQAPVTGDFDHLSV